MSSNQIAFEYFNRSTNTVEVWLSVAPGTKNVNFSGDIQPISIQDHEFLGSICYFQVPSRQRLKYTSEYSPVENYELTDEERNYFLRNTALIPVNKDTRKTAKSIIKNVDSKEDKDQIFSIFNYVKNNYKYSAAIKQRGFEYATEDKKGDCGELSAIIASYCRSIDIPCRMMIGACRGKSNHHAWNEVYLPEEGWIPLDVSLAMYTFFRHPLRDLGAGVKWGAFINKKRYFGNIESGRVVYSIDPERYLSPIYIDSEPPVNDMTFNVAGKDLAWGYESLDGCAPYMQPIYPKLNKSFKSIKNKDVLGKFGTYSSSIIDKVSYKTKMNSLSIGAVFVYISIFISLFNIETSVLFDLLLGSGTLIAFGIFSFLTILRREFNWPIFILSILSLLSAIGFIHDMIIYLA